MTIAIASYQRRESLRRLLSQLAREVEGAPSLAKGLDVVVVLDGSDDGSKEMAEDLPMAVPVEVCWKPNGGLASARNLGLARATGELIWFLDDDLVPAEGTLARHRDAHVGPAPQVVVGPCVIPEGSSTPSEIAGWWRQRYAAIQANSGITRFDHFSGANTSAPVDLLLRVGAFDERFVGYGCEDYELGLRLLDDGVVISFEVEAIAWHEQRRTVAEACRLRRDEGANLLRFAELHPDRLDDIAGAPVGPGLRLAGRLLRRLRHPLRVLADLAIRLVGAVEGRRAAHAAKIGPLAGHIGYLAGIVERDLGSVVAARAVGRFLKGGRGA